MHENDSVHENEPVIRVHFHMDTETKGNWEMACYKTEGTNHTQVYLKICKASTEFY